MKILVTGANGFLGKAVVWKLLEHGERDIRCLVRPGRDVSRLREMAKAYPDGVVDILWGDVMSREQATRAVENVGAVYHLAAGIRGSAAVLVQNSVVGSRNLLEGLVGNGGARVCLVSSIAVYGTVGLPAGSVVDEASPLERDPAQRDLYSFAKIRQEKLFWEYREKHRFPLVVVRPGVIYGAGGAGIPARVGIQFPGLFVHMGCGNTLPLTYVENCADAVVLLGGEKGVDGEAYNVIDDDLPTSREFFGGYRKQVEALRYVAFPYAVTMALSKLIETYHKKSRGQLPDILTPYKSEYMWKGMRYGNTKLKAAGWKQAVSTSEGMGRYYAYWREQGSSEKSR